MTDVIRHEDLIIDEETGEILEWPAGVAEVDRLDYMQQQHAEALAQEKVWAGLKGGYSRALGSMLGERGVKSYAGSSHRTTWVAPKDAESCPKAMLQSALQFQGITQEQYDEIIERTIETLEKFPVAVLDAMVTEAKLTAEQRRGLVISEPRNGYSLTKVLPKEEPKRAAAKRKEYAEEAWVS